MKFYIKTYGCQMNLRDSDSAAALLIEHGFAPADGEADADLVILNTCSVRDQAERKAIGKLGFLGKLKRERPWMIFGIMGCMAQSRGAELLKRIRHLDFAIGTDQIHRIPQVIDEVEEFRMKKACLEAGSATEHGIDSHRFDGAESPHSAFVSIMRGCSRYCSYCIVPFVRGPERSRPMDSILAECRTLAAHGVPEIFLLGQNVSAYGLDNTAPPPDDAPSPFGELLKGIAAIDGVRRIRFTSPHPAYFTQALIDAFTQTDKVCKYVHLPLQSGSDRVLKLMNRPYDTAKYLSITDRLRERAPWMSFSTDVIVGFPTETEADFQATRELMDRVGFDNAFIFKYSPRKGTRSAQNARRRPAGGQGGTQPDPAGRPRTPRRRRESETRRTDVRTPRRGPQQTQLRALERPHRHVQAGRLHARSGQSRRKRRLRACEDRARHPHDPVRRTRPRGEMS